MYTITDLGPRYAAALNNLGDVVGNSAGTPWDTNGPAYIYHSYGPAAGAFIDLSGQGGTGMIPTGINDSGQVSGTIKAPAPTTGFSTAPVRSPRSRPRPPRPTPIRPGSITPEP